MSERKVIHAHGVSVALCADCGSVHFHLLGASDEVVAVAHLDASDVPAVVDLMEKAVVEIAQRGVGGGIRFH